MSSKKLIGVWRAMHNRCYNKNQASYQNYGARGIGVHPDWHGAEGYKRFLADMGPWSEGMTLERKDNDADYSADNCRWATRLEQAQNKRNNHYITVAGETLSVAAWARRLGCTPSAIHARLAAGLAPEEAVQRPVPKRPNARLQEDDARFVRANYPAWTCTRLAQHLGVSKKTVLNIIHNRTFADVV